MANRICLTCGRTYDFCGSCPTSANLPMWKNIYDTEDCMGVFQVVSDYAQGVITKDAAKEKLSQYNLSVQYKEKIRKYIDEIVAEEKVDVVEVVEETIETKENKNDVPKNNRKKAYKR